MHCALLMIRFLHGDSAPCMLGSTAVSRLRFRLSVARTRLDTGCFRTAHVLLLDFSIAVIIALACDSFSSFSNAEYTRTVNGEGNKSSLEMFENVTSQMTVMYL
jgi:hypothetical protein